MSRFRVACAALAGVGGLAWALDARLHGASFYAYLAAFAFVASTALGALVLLMVAELSAASWFVVLRRLGEAVAGVTPLLVPAFAPIAVGVRAIYPWAGSLEGLDEGTQRSIEHARAWMNTPLFLGRAALFLALWLALEQGMRRASLSEDAGRAASAERRRKVLSAVGLPLIAFSGSFAAFDWFMSAVAGWNSNIFGLYLLCGGFSSAMGVLCVGFHQARRARVFPVEVAEAHTHALGRMLFMSVCLWAYMTVSQLVIVWSANLPREAAFYLARYQGPFRVLALALVFAHFAVPFLLLLSRWLKQRSSVLALLGGLTVVMHAVDMYWLLAPAGRRGVSPLDWAPFLFVGALAAILAVWRFGRAPAVPTTSPELQRSLAYESP